MILEDNTIESFEKHIPTNLRQQLASRIVQQYFNTLEPFCGDCCVPSIERFHGALLFVDISGFTVLSQRLNVDELRTHINGYFKKLLGIVEKYKGQVVKFAGDALFIIWKTAVNNIHCQVFQEAASTAAHNAISCGIEIISTCSNYKINLDQFHSTDSHLASMLMMSLPHHHARFSPHHAHSPSSHNYSPPSSTGHSENVAYLNVHAGVGVGVMAGMDVGVNDRWEYIIIGEPLRDVAVAESEANRGELAISAAAHEYLHPSEIYGDALSSPAAAAAAIGRNGSGSCSSTGVKTFGRTQSQQMDDKSAAIENLLEHDIMPCGCQKTKSGCFKINDYLRHVATRRRRRNTEELPEAYQEIDLQLHVDTVCELTEAFKAHHALIVHDEKMMEQISAIKRHIQRKLSVSSPEEVLGSPNYEAIMSENVHSELVELLLEHFLQWSENCLCDDIARHVHEANRMHFDFRKISRKDEFAKFLEKEVANAASEESLKARSHNARARSVSAQSSLHIGSGGSSVHNSAHITSGHNRHLSLGFFNGKEGEGTPHHNEISHRRHSHILMSQSNSNSPSTHTGTSSSIMNRISRHLSVDTSLNKKLKSADSSNFVDKIRRISLPKISMRRQSQTSNHERILNQDATLIAELRNVIVLFINVQVPLSSLHMDSCGDDSMDYTVDTCKIDSFHFLTRTQREYEEDLKLLQQFQQCMEILTQAFHDHGGQLRQFIVDDKGTVCIGTFGLRGSTNYDNAATAVEAANCIITRLRKIGIEVSIGVTSGKAYCGIVGSPNRHEYAVMGPSTNLSARLMGKASLGEVVCDVETRKKDRQHKFLTLSEVHAKGYAHLVPTFRPLFRASAPGDNGNGIKGKGVNTAFSPYPPNTGSETARSEGTAYSANTGTAYTLSLSNKVATRTKFHGRKSEIERIFQFFGPTIFRDTLEEGNENDEGSPDGEVAEGEVRGLSLQPAGADAETMMLPSPYTPSISQGNYNVHFSALIAIVIGPHGIGKTSLLHVFCDKLTKISNHAPRAAINLHNTSLFEIHSSSASCPSHINTNIGNLMSNSQNISIFRNKSNGYNVSPFYAWKTIFHQLLDTFRLLMSDEQAYSFPENDSIFSGKYEDTGGGDDGSEKVVGWQSQAAHQAVDHLMRDISPELKNFKPLLRPLRLLHGLSDNEHTLKLSGPYRIQKSVELMAALVQQFTYLTGRLCVLLLDDMQSMDLASWQLLCEIWHHNSGVVFLTSFRPITANCRRHAVIDATATSTGTDIFSVFENSDRCLKIDLETMDAEAVKSIAVDILESNNIYYGDDNDDLFKKLFTISGGNPLYAYELTKAITDRYVSNSAKDKDLPLLLTYIEEFRSTKAEEVIMYRYDQLDSYFQLVLKMASVACSNHSFFTIQMLSFMLECENRRYQGAEDGIMGEEELGEEGELANAGSRGDLTHITEEATQAGESTEFDDVSGKTKSSLRRTISMLNNPENLAATIRVMLANNEFIQIRRKTASLMYQRSHKGTLNTYSIDRTVSEAYGEGIFTKTKKFFQEENSLEAEDSIEHLKFEFRIELEQRTIYDILLDDQKESLHDRVATFLELECIKKPKVSLADLFEQGFHWERARIWNNAMTCYYNAALLLDKKGAYHDCCFHLSAAYRMLDVMRKDAGVVDKASAEPATFHLLFDNTASKALLQRFNSSNSKSAETTPNTTPTSQRSRINKADLRKVFGNDPELLEVGLNVILKLAQVYSMISEDVAIMSRLYDEALHLIKLTAGNDRRAKSQRLILIEGETSGRIANGSSAFSAVQQVSGKNAAVDDGEEPFELRNKMVVFPILSGIAMLFRSKKLLDDGRCSKESAIIELYLSLAAKSSSDPACLVHLLFGYGLARPLYLKLGKVKEALDLADKIKSLYSYERHSSEIVRYHHFDNIPLTLAYNISLLAMLGHLDKTEEHLKYILQLIPNISHTNTLSAAVHSVCGVYVLLNDVGRALELLDQYFTYLNTKKGYTDAHFSSLPQEMDILLCLWLDLTMQVESKTCSAPPSPTYRSTAADSSPTEPIPAVLSKDDTAAVEEKATECSEQTASTSRKGSKCAELMSNTIVEKVRTVTFDFGETVNLNATTPLLETTHFTRQQLLAVEDHIQKKAFLPASDSARPHLYYSFDMRGTGIEFVCGSVCFLKGKLLYQDLERSLKTHNLRTQSVSDIPSAKATIAEAMHQLNLAVEYANYAIKCTKDNPANHLCHILAMALKVEVLCLMHHMILLHQQEDSYKSVLIPAAKDLLKTCEVLARNENYLLVLLLVGNLWFKLQLDVAYGEYLQMETIKLLKLSYFDGMRFPEKWRALLTICPELQRLEKEFIVELP